MTESDLQELYIYPINPRNSKIYSDKGFVNIDNGARGGTHWTCFMVKDNKPYYFDSFGGQPVKFQSKQSRKAITYPNYKKRDINFKLFGSYCLYIFYLIKRLKYYDAILKMYFN